MDIKKKLEEQESIVKSLNESIDDISGGLIVEFIGPLRKIVVNPIGRWLLKKIASGDDDTIDKKEIKDKIDTSNIGGDIESSKDGKGMDELVSDMRKLLDKQIDLFNKINKTNFAKMRIEFGSSVDFQVKRGPKKGKKLKLEGTKDYIVHKIEKDGSKYKVYFLYQNWLRDNGIMFSLKTKNITDKIKQDDITINIVYTDTSSKVGSTVEIMEEKVLTHKAKVTIKNIK